MSNRWTEQRIILSDENDKTRGILTNESAIYYGDIVSKTLNGRKYSIPVGAELGELPTIDLPRDHRQILRRDQAYLSWDGHNVLEILGLVDNFVVLVRAWNFTGDCTVALADKTDKPIEMHFYDIFPHDCATRYFLSKDFYRNGNIHRKIMRITAQNAPPRGYTNNPAYGKSYLNTKNYSRQVRYTRMAHLPLHHRRRTNSLVSSPTQERLPAQSYA